MDLLKLSCLNSRKRICIEFCISLKPCLFMSSCKLGCNRRYERFDNEIFLTVTAQDLNGGNMFRYRTYILPILVLLTAFREVVIVC